MSLRFGAKCEVGGVSGQALSATKRRAGLVMSAHDVGCFQAILVSQGPGANIRSMLVGPGHLAIDHSRQSAEAERPMVVTLIER